MLNERKRMLSLSLVLRRCATDLKAHYVRHDDDENKEDDIVIMAIDVNMCT